MPPININVNLATETEFLINDKEDNHKSLKICLVSAACIYSLAICALGSVILEKSKYECSGLKNDSLLQCKKIEHHLEIARDCLLISITIPIVFAVGFCICTICTKSGGCREASLLHC